MTSMTTKQHDELNLPDGAQEPFDLETIIEPKEIRRLTWWFLQVFPVSEDSLYIETILDVGTPTPVWGVRIVKTVFNVRYGARYGSEGGGPTWRITPPRSITSKLEPSLA